MAKESTIRSKCIEELRSRGWVVWVPTRNRYGAGLTHNKDGYKAGDDIFNIFDLIGWKKGELLFVQYTSRDNFSARVNKITDFILDNDLDYPCCVEVWGYEDRKGFTRVEKLSNDKI